MQKVNLRRIFRSIRTYFALTRYSCRRPLYTYTELVNMGCCILYINRFDT